MRKILHIVVRVVLITVVAAILGLAALFLVNLYRPARTNDARISIFNNLRRLDSAKKQWASEQKAPPGSWPTKHDILLYLTPDPDQGFDKAVPSRLGEIYVLNRTDRPVAVFFPKDTRDLLIPANEFEEGQLLTLDDLQRHYDLKYGRQTAPQNAVSPQAP
jgi:hypothetical protein